MTGELWMEDIKGMGSLPVPFSPVWFTGERKGCGINGYGR